MRHDRFSPHEDHESIDLDGIGIDLDDLDLDDPALNLPPDVRSLLEQRPRYERREHWHTSEAEAHNLDLPDFSSHEHRTRFFITRMARAHLRTIGGNDDTPAFSYFGETVSLNDLLAGIDYQCAAIAQVMR